MSTNNPKPSRNQQRRARDRQKREGGSYQQALKAQLADELTDALITKAREIAVPDIPGEWDQLVLVCEAHDPDLDPDTLAASQVARILAAWREKIAEHAPAGSSSWPVPEDPSVLAAQGERLNAWLREELESAEHTNRSLREQAARLRAGARMSDDGYEYDDGSVVKFPDSTGTIEIVDADGDTRECVAAGEQNWQQYASLFGNRPEDFLSQRVAAELLRRGKCLPTEYGTAEPPDSSEETLRVLDLARRFPLAPGFPCSIPPGNVRFVIIATGPDGYQTIMAEDIDQAVSLFAQAERPEFIVDLFRDPEDCVIRVGFDPERGVRTFDLESSGRLAVSDLHEGYATHLDQELALSAYVDGWEERHHGEAEIECILDHNSGDPRTDYLAYEIIDVATGAGREVIRIAADGTISHPDPDRTPARPLTEAQAEQQEIGRAELRLAREGIAVQPVSEEPFSRWKGLRCCSCHQELALRDTDVENPEWDERLRTVEGEHSITEYLPVKAGECLNPDCECFRAQADSEPDLVLQQDAISDGLARLYKLDLAAAASFERDWGFALSAIETSGITDLAANEPADMIDKLADLLDPDRARDSEAPYVPEPVSHPQQQAALDSYLKDYQRRYGIGPDRVRLADDHNLGDAYSDYRTYELIAGGNVHEVIRISAGGFIRRFDPATGQETDDTRPCILKSYSYPERSGEELMTFSHCLLFDLEDGETHAIENACELLRNGELTVSEDGCQERYTVIDRRALIERYTVIDRRALIAQIRLFLIEEDYMTETGDLAQTLAVEPGLLRSAPCPSCGKDRPYPAEAKGTFEPGSVCPSCGHVEPESTGE